MESLQKRQKRVFTNFVNANIQDYGREITSLSDLSSGVDLYYLLKTIGQKTEKKGKANRSQIIKMNNCQVILTYLQKIENVRLDGINAVNISKGEEKIIMALLWSIITHFHLKIKPESGERGFLKNFKKLTKWVNTKCIADEEEKIKDISSFSTGKPLFYIVKYLLETSKLNDDDFLISLEKENNPTELLQKLMGYSEKKFNIPKLCKAQDFVNNPDELTVMTYISCFKHYRKREKKNRKKRRLSSQFVHEKGKLRLKKSQVFRMEKEKKKRREERKKKKERRRKKREMKKDKLEEGLEGKVEKVVEKEEVRDEKEVGKDVEKEQKVVEKDLEEEKDVEKKKQEIIEKKEKLEEEEKQKMKIERVVEEVEKKKQEVIEINRNLEEDEKKQDTEKDQQIEVKVKEDKEIIPKPKIEEEKPKIELTNEEVGEMIEVDINKEIEKVSEEKEEDKVPDTDEWQEIEIDERGMNGMLDHYPIKPDDFQNDKIHKICVTGNTGVGKTSIVNRFVNNEFAKTKPTLSFTGNTCTFKPFADEDDDEEDDFSEKKKFKSPIHFNLIDTAGEERFSSLSPQYFRNSSGIICVFDKTNKDSFQNTKNWIKFSLKHAKEGCVILLLANKTDLKKDVVVEQEDIMDLIREFAIDHTMLYYEVSAKSGENVHKSISNFVEIVGYKFSESYRHPVDVRREMVNFNEEKVDISKGKSGRKTKIFRDNCCSGTPHL